MSKEPTPSTFHGYTREQWAEIVASVSQFGLTPSGLDYLRGDLMRATMLDVEDGVRDLIKSHEGYASDARKALRAISELRSIMDMRIKWYNEGIGTVMQDLDEEWIGPALERERDQLIGIEHIYTKELAFHIREIEAYTPIAERVRAKKKTYQERLFDLVGVIWTRLGGTVSQQKDYRRFFEAVVKPIYTEELRWMHRSAWTESLFAEHAKAWMERAGIQGTRGRRRKGGTSEGLSI
ncbi:hypothetical protein ACTZWW_03075 [Salinarimonas sp. NSM]|uniref:hypothetical protein n=1 Tax=Salinarimonas sp. NSM TaxID=3458003 RepID=UPI004036AD26